MSDHTGRTNDRRRERSAFPSPAPAMSDRTHKSARNDRNGGQDKNGLDARGRKRKNSFTIFYIITMIIGVVVCVTLFAVAYSTIIEPNNFLLGSSPIRTDQEPREFVRVEESQALGMVTEMDSFNPRTLTVALLDTNRSDRFNLTDNTSIQNRHGNPISFGEINVGQIVEVTFDANTRNISNLSLSGRAWEQNRSNVEIDLEAATITIGNQVYTYSSRTLVLNRGEPYSIALINPEDVVTLVGYQDKIWSIRIDTGHGFIRFLNADQIVDGTVQIGNFHFSALDGARAISATEGVHRVIIDGQNIDTFMADVVVRQGQTVEVDLRTATLRFGTLQFIMDNSEEATVFINGGVVTLDVNSLVQAEYGIHLIRVERPGFVPIQQEIELNQPLMRIELDLAQDSTEVQILIETFPPDAQVFVNHAFVGNSPVTIEVEHGNHAVIARRAGYEDQTLNITVDATSSRQFIMPMIQLPVHPPSTNVPPPGNHLPPPPADWGPIPTPTIPADWMMPVQTPAPPPEIPPQQVPPQQVPPQQIPPPQIPPPEIPPAAPHVPPPGEPAWTTHPEDLLPPNWPPAVEDLPLPPGF